MAKTFQFDLVSPEAILISKPVMDVVIPGREGDFGVLADHARLLSSVRPGVIRVTYEDQETAHIYVGGGFADVGDNMCTVLAEDTRDVQDLDRAEIETQVADLKKQCTDCETPEQEHLIRQQLEQAIAQLDACDCYH